MAPFAGMDWRQFGRLTTKLRRRRCGSCAHGHPGRPALEESLLLTVLYWRAAGGTWLVRIWPSIAWWVRREVSDVWESPGPSERDCFSGRSRRSDGIRWNGPEVPPPLQCDLCSIR